MPLGLRRNLCMQVHASPSKAKKTLLFWNDSMCNCSPEIRQQASDPDCLAVIKRAALHHTDAPQPLPNVISQVMGVQFLSRPFAAPAVLFFLKQENFRSQPQGAMPEKALFLFTGLGGFTSVASESVTVVTPRCMAPISWTNVLAHLFPGRQVAKSRGA